MFVVAANDNFATEGRDVSQWAASGGNQASMRHSALTDVNIGSVAKLQMIWSQSSGGLRYSGQPLVVSNVGGRPMMFFVSAWPNIVQALDLSDPNIPKQLWNYDKKTDRDYSAVPHDGCCGTVNRSVSYANGRVVFGTLDGFIIALDALTGQMIWTVKHAHPEHGETVTTDPIIADDQVIAGFGGDELVGRGSLVAYDLKTGQVAWTCQGAGIDEKDCVTSEINNRIPQFGTDSKQRGEFTHSKDGPELGGGSPWTWVGFDPQLRIVYALTGSPVHWDLSQGCGADSQAVCNQGRWRNSRSIAMYARKIDTGAAVWAYQMPRVEQTDSSGVNDNILVDLTVDGKLRKCLVHLDHNGIAYILDRVDGTVLRAGRIGSNEWAARADLKTEQPSKAPSSSSLARRVNIDSCHSGAGDKDQQPCAVDPADPTKLYCPTNNWCSEDETEDRTHTARGAVYTIANVPVYPQKLAIKGKLNKFDLLTGESDWEITDSYPNWSSALVTDGGLVFYGSLSGDFRAVDRKTGAIVWHRKLGSGIIGDPVTYKIKGKQYISVWAGFRRLIRSPAIAGLSSNDTDGAVRGSAMPKIAEFDHVRQGDTLYTFALQE
jgi:lanthanide-dependent methanol dehydrogenase